MYNTHIPAHQTGLADILIPIVCFHGLIINISPGNAIGQYVQIACCIVSIWFFLGNRVYDKSVKGLVWTIFSLFVCMGMSSFLVRYEQVLGNTKLSNPFTSILLSCQLLSFLGLSIYTHKRNSWYVTFGTLYYISFCYVVIMSLYALSLGKNHDPDRYFIFQNKFDFSYLLVFLIALYRSRHRRFYVKNYLFLCLLSVFAVFMVYWVDCTTGVVLVVLMFIAFLFEEVLAVWLARKSVLLLSLPILDVGFYLFYNLILTLPNVSFFIENILGKESSLTGRIYIYEAMSNIIMDRPLWGVGPRNGTAAMAYLLGMPNAQNGLLYMYLEIGLLGLMCFFSIYILLINKVNLKVGNYGMLVYLYCMILASTIEINIGVNFLCYSCLLLIPTMNVNRKRVG